MTNHSFEASATKTRSAGKKTVHLADDVHIQLGKAAKKFKTKNSDFANAAITYFTESGIDPRKATKVSLAKLEGRVVRESLAARENNANIGNRLVGIIRVFEKNLGDYLQKQHGGTAAHLERIERNLLGYLVTLQENLLAPMMERMIRTNLEGHMNRIVLQAVALQLKGQKFPYSEIEMGQTTANYDKQLDSQLAGVIQRLLEEKKMERPRLSAKSENTAMPKPPAPTKPGAPDAATGAAQPATGATLAPSGTTLPTTSR